MAREAHRGGLGDGTWDDEGSRQFFRMVAERLVAATNPESVLDVGCSRGLLVQALGEKGVDAYGVDPSEQAIAAAHSDVRERLRVAAPTMPFDSKYGMVTCLEVLEHLSPVDAQVSIDNMTSATDLVLFSVSAESSETGHPASRSSEQWAAWFAERGFHRRIDVDLSFLSPWAILFERTDLTPRSLVQRYEQLYARTRTQMLETQDALAQAQRRLELATPAEQVKQWEAEVLEVRHELLVSRDHSLGNQAEIGRLNRDLMGVTERLQFAERQVGRLTVRRDKLGERLAAVRQRAQRSQQRVTALRARVQELEAEVARLNASPSRRIWRRLRGRDL